MRWKIGGRGNKAAAIRRDRSTETAAPRLASPRLLRLMEKRRCSVLMKLQSNADHVPSHLDGIDIVCPIDTNISTPVAGTDSGSVMRTRTRKFVVRRRDKLRQLLRRRIPRSSSNNSTTTESNKGRRLFSDSKHRRTLIDQRGIQRKFRGTNISTCR